MTEDWSNVRSPSRALRRLSLGHRQNIREMTEAERHEMEAVTHAMHSEARTILSGRSRLLRERREDLEDAT